MNESGSQENRKKQSRFLAKAFGAADENKLRHDLDYQESMNTASRDAAG
jgi:hypothetical protein